MLFQGIMLIVTLYFVKKALSNTSEYPYPDSYYDPTTAMPGVVDFNEKMAKSKNVLSSHWPSVDENWQKIDAKVNLMGMQNYKDKYVALTNDLVNCHTNQYIDPKFEGARKVFPRVTITNL